LEVSLLIIQVLLSHRLAEQHGSAYECAFLCFSLVVT
jgi:hypothetical protein